MQPHHHPFSAIIFDFDGVILDSEPLHYEAVTDVLNKLGLKLNYKEYTEKYIGLSDKEMFPMLLKNKGFHFSADAISSLINEKIDAYTHIINNHHELPLITGVDLYIHKAIQNDKKIAICTGSTKNEISITLAKLMLIHLFNTIVTAEDVRHGKPSPESYLLTAKRLGVPANQCIVIEDTPHGITAAKNAGMYVIALTTTHENQCLQNADQVVAGFEELLDATSHV